MSLDMEGEAPKNLCSNDSALLDSSPSSFHTNCSNFFSVFSMCSKSSLSPISHSTELRVKSDDPDEFVCHPSGSICFDCCYTPTSLPLSPLSQLSSRGTVLTMADNVHWILPPAVQHEACDSNSRCSPECCSTDHLSVSQYYVANGNVDKAINTLLSYLYDPFAVSSSHSRHILLSDCLAKNQTADSQQHDAMVWCQLGTLYFSQNKLKEAVLALEAAAKLKANDPFILYYFGAILIRYGDLERAKQVLEKSKLCGGTCGNSSLDQCYVPAVFELGCLYSRLNCLDKASENFESIVAQEPDNGAALVQLADCLERQCQFDDAYEILQSFLLILLLFLWAFRARRLDLTDYSIVRAMERLFRLKSQSDTEDVISRCSTGCPSTTT